MTFTYVLSTDIGRVRALLPDIVEASAQFSDEEITAFLELAGDSVFIAAALALERLAMSALSRGKIRLPDLEVDQTSLAKTYLDRAKALREQADEGDVAEFDVIEQVYSPFGLRAHLANEYLRGGA